MVLGEHPAGLVRAGLSSHLHTPAWRRAPAGLGFRWHKPGPCTDPMGLPRTEAAQQQWDDPWFAVDKAEHFAFCVAITACAYQAARWREPLRRYRLLLGCAAGVAAGLLKELGDGLQVRPHAVPPPPLPCHSRP